MMNQDSENNLPGDGSDPKVSAEYRAIATERTPPGLDAEVLKKADAAVGNSGLRGFTAFWFRPLAFVATLGLSLALLLEVTQPPDLQSVRSTETEIGRPESESIVADPVPADIGATTEVRGRVDLPTQSKGTSEPSPPAEAIIRGSNEAISPPATLISPPTDEHSSADFAYSLEESAKLTQERDRARAGARLELRQFQADIVTQAEDVAGLRTTLNLVDVVARPCTEEQLAVPATWWQCISDLEEAGRHEEAKVELDLFNTANPDFEAPLVLPSQ